MRLLVIGFDAVGCSSVLPRPPPRLKEVMRTHIHGRLKSTRCPVTLPAMFAIYEGIDRSED